MKKFQQYISSNLLSLSGYALVIFTSLIIFYFYPQALQDSLKDAPTDNFEITTSLFIWLINIIKCFLTIEVILFFFMVIESNYYEDKQDLYKKFFNKIPDIIKKPHALLFYTGIIFALIPVFLLALYILDCIVEFIFL